MKVSRKNNENARDKAIKRAVELGRVLGSTEDEKSSVEFFFYAGAIDNALDLVKELKKIKYFVECVKTNDEKEKFLITGITTPILIEETEIIKWAILMENIAGHYNCKFDGWGRLIGGEKNEKNKLNNTNDNLNLNHI